MTQSRAAPMVLVYVLSALPCAAQTTDPDIAAADELWSRRAEGHEGSRAAAEPISSAIAAYERIIAARPNDVEARWKLLRALQFFGDYVLDDPEQRLVLFERGRDIASDTMAELLAGAGLEPEERDPEIVAAGLQNLADAAPLYFFAAIHWGLWGEYTGKMKAARQGVAGRIRDYAATVVLLDERMDGGGGLRFLGRLHTEAPRIPFVTGWVDRQQAVEYLDRACAIDPTEPENQLYLADALLRFAKERTAEARRRLEGIAATAPRPGHLIEDSSAISAARALLEDAD